MSVVHPLLPHDSPRRILERRVGDLEVSTGRRRLEMAVGQVDAAAQALCPIDVEIQRAEAAYQLMLVADTCLKVGADRLLLELGFSEAHIARLRDRAGPGGGYPAYAIRNIRQTLRILRRTRAEPTVAE